MFRDLNRAPTERIKVEGVATRELDTGILMDNIGGKSAGLRVAAKAPVDLRSDTVTKPTEAMYRRMVNAPLGDDGLDGDPTVLQLEQFAAETLGKDAALFVPSCTMANLLAILVSAKRNAQVAVEAESHIYGAERGGATFSGAFYLPIEGQSGAMDLNRLESALQGNSSRLPTELVCMETSHNNAGGTALSLAHMEAVYQMGQHHGANVHLDGARLFNAAVYLGEDPKTLVQFCDTVSLCLSKGLSAPVGALLVGKFNKIAQAKGIRRMLGGQLRQAGVIAAAGLEALETMPQRLAEDHKRTAALAVGLQRFASSITVKAPQTNIVLVDVKPSGRTPVAWANELADKGLLVRPWRDNKLRCVIHRHIDDENIQMALAIFDRVITAHERARWPTRTQ